VSSPIATLDAAAASAAAAFITLGAIHDVAGGLMVALAGTERSRMTGASSD